MSNANIREVLIKELKKLPEDRGLKMADAPKEAWVKCWDKDHKNGNESTPSLRIRLDAETSAFPVGSWICFGCAKHGKWEDIAKQFKLKGVNKLDMYNDSAPQIMSTNLRNRMFGGGLDLPPGAYEWPADQDWRNINGKIMHKVGSMVYFDSVSQKPRIFFPVHVYDDLVGGIKTNILPVTYASNSHNTDGEWAKKIGLFPFDYVRENMRCDVIALVEGARDALNLIQNGLAALAILGGTNSWSKQKGDLIWGLNPKIILRAFDNDESGIGASKKAKLYFNKKVDQYKIALPDKAKTGLDASDLKPKQIKVIKEKFVKPRKKKVKKNGR